MDAGVEKQERTYRQTDKQADGETSYIKIRQFLWNLEMAIDCDDTVH
jgi:hypothetical protein